MNIPSLIEVVLGDYTQKSKLFTAHDITRAVRQLTTENVEHSDVRQAIEDTYSNLAYMRTSRKLLNGVSAFVYHPIGTSSDDYGMVFKRIDPTVTQSAAPKVDSSQPSSRSHGDNLNVDRWGRIRVPAHVTRAIGANVVNIQPVADGVVVGANIPGTPYKVDVYGNVRLTLRGSLRTKTRFRVVPDGGNFVLKAQ